MVVSGCMQPSQLLWEVVVSHASSEQQNIDIVLICTKNNNKTIIL